MLSTKEQPETDLQFQFYGLTLRCPRCGAPLPAEPAMSYRACDSCSFQLLRRDGIWRALPAEREQYYAQFVADYERIRTAEGRGSESSSYYLALPYRDLSEKNSLQWTIRRRTYEYFLDHILPEILATGGAGARVLDAGAGNGWFSYRLAMMGLRPVAVDLLVNQQDGLGAARHFEEHLPTMFPRFQAESTHLPFGPALFDAVIFNASLHYAENYTATLLEALRCLKAGGMIVVADSPWYSKEASGERMVAERQAAFLSRYGTRSDSIRSQEFLTDERLDDLEVQLGLRWRRHTPSYGVRWAMRPWIARLRGRREPARFRIYTARKLA
ncbi:MAG TPA: class I SAM-dependent methyltransferase [Acidisarcina sp.]